MTAFIDCSPPRPGADKSTSSLGSTHPNNLVGRSVSSKLRPSWERGARNEACMRELERGGICMFVQMVSHVPAPFQTPKLCQVVTSAKVHKRGG